MIPSVLPHRYPGGFSPSKLVEDVVAALHAQRTAARSTWISRPTGWQVIPLRSRGGRVDDPTEGFKSSAPWKDTEVLAHCPTFQLVIAETAIRTGLQVTSARVSRLEPGGAIPYHSDDHCGLRVHVPIVTNEHSVMELESVEHRWQPGEMWIADFARTHRAWNKGTTERIHLLLVLDR